MYRGALSLRKQLLTAEEMEWVEDSPDTVLHMRRPGGWHSITNLGPEPVTLPAGSVLITSIDLDDDGLLPTDSTAWVLTRQF